MSPQTVAYQIDAYLAYAAKPGSLSFDEWMDSKDFSAPERRELRRELRTRANPQERKTA